MINIKLPTGVFEYDPNKPLDKAGGFGQVFHGKSSSGEYVAVKKLHISGKDLAHRELRIADELKGRPLNYIVPFIDAGEDTETGDYFIVMPKAEYSLQNMVNKNGPLAPQETSSILLQIATGLIEVGELVHRDIKPDNILFHEQKWKIADFGIARFVSDATASNTLKNYLSQYYAAPEQWRSERATHATDVYALGCMAFFLLTGRPPFINDPKEEHLNSPVPSFDCIDPRLKTFVNMCLRKVDSSRPSLSRVRDQLEEIFSNPALAVAGSSLADLADAAAHVSNQQLAAQAHEASEKNICIARTKLASSGYEILADNVERLWGKIHSQAPNARRNNIVGLFQCYVGSARLEITLNKNFQIEPNKFAFSEWDVVTYSHISINQEKPHYFWSASLWFTKLKEGSDYRWYEPSYWNDIYREFEPHAEHPGRDADIATSRKGWHSVHMAFGPIAVDDERENDFHDRWIWLLSKAAFGQLSRPSCLPINSWPPQLS
ncbi:MAG: serine/threonine protein kinase [Chlorobaculum sp.]|nr:serine/threonine protein kinase [Chlorobaculum sp.]